MPPQLGLRPRAWALQLLKPTGLEPALGNKRTHCTEKPVVAVQSLSHVRLCDPMDCSMQSFTISRSLLKLIESIESVMPSHYLILCRPLLPPSNFPSIRVFRVSGLLHQVAKGLGQE